LKKGEKHISMQKVRAYGALTEHSFLGKKLPANMDAEKAVLGAILLNDQTFAQAVEVLRPEDFYHPPNQIIFEVMTHLVNAMKRIDMVTLQDELSKRNILDSIGGVLYIVSLQEDIPEVGLIEQHAKIVKEKSVLRELIISATEIIQNCYQPKEDTLPAIIDRAEKAIFLFLINKQHRTLFSLIFG